MCTDVYGSLIHNCPDLEAAKVSEGRWMDTQLWYLQIMEYYSMLKWNELSSYEMTQRKQTNTAPWKKLIWKGFIFCDFNDMIFWER